MVVVVAAGVLPVLLLVRQRGERGRLALHPPLPLPPLPLLLPAVAARGDPAGGVGQLGRALPPPDQVLGGLLLLRGLVVRSLVDHVADGP